MAYARARRQPHAQAANVGAEPSSILPRSAESPMKSPASGKGLWGNRKLDAGPIPILTRNDELPMNHDHLPRKYVHLADAAFLAGG
jgi:hypothetical protein